MQSPSADSATRSLLHPGDSSNSTKSSTAHDLASSLELYASVFSSLYSLLFTALVMCAAWPSLAKDSLGAHHAAWLLVLEASVCVFTVVTAWLKSTRRGQTFFTLLGLTAGAQVLLFIFTGATYAVYFRQYRGIAVAWSYVFYFWPLIMALVLHLLAQRPGLALIIFLAPYALAVIGASLVLAQTRATIFTIAQESLPSGGLVAVSSLFFLAKAASFFLGVGRYMLKFIVRRKTAQLVQLLETMMFVNVLQVACLVLEQSTQLDVFRELLTAVRQVLSDCQARLAAQVDDLLHFLFGTTDKSQDEQRAARQYAVQPTPHKCSAVVLWLLWLVAFIMVWVTEHKVRVQLGDGGPALWSTRQFSLYEASVALLAASGAWQLLVLVVPLLLMPVDMGSEVKDKVMLCVLGMYVAITVSALLCTLLLLQYTGDNGMPVVQTGGIVASLAMSLLLAVLSLVQVAVVLWRDGDAPRLFVWSPVVPFIFTSVVQIVGNILAALVVAALTPTGTVIFSLGIAATLIAVPFAATHQPVFELHSDLPGWQGLQDVNVHRYGMCWTCGGQDWCYDFSTDKVEQSDFEGEYPPECDRDVDSLCWVLPVCVHDIDTMWTSAILLMTAGGSIATAVFCMFAAMCAERNEGECCLGISGCLAVLSTPAWAPLVLTATSMAVHWLEQQHWDHVDVTQTWQIAVGFTLSLPVLFATLVLAYVYIPDKLCS